MRMTFALAATLLAAPAAALPLPPGGSFDLATLDGAEAIAIAPDDPAWSGPVLSAQDASASVTYGGFDGFEERDDFNNAGGIIRSRVLDVGGLLTFGYTFVNDAPLSLEPGSPARAAIPGFQGLEVAIAAVGIPFVDIGPELVSRSDDGDTILIEFNPFNDEDAALFGSTTEFLFRTDAPRFRADGSATLDLAIRTFGSETVAVSPGVLVPAPIPLPAGLPLLALGLCALGLAGRRRRG